MATLIIGLNDLIMQKICLWFVDSVHPQQTYRKSFQKLCTLEMLKINMNRNR